MFIDPTKISEKYGNNLFAEYSKEQGNIEVDKNSVFDYSQKTEAFQKTKGSSFFLKNAVYGKPEGKEENVLDTLDQQVDMTAKNRKDQMVVMANTLSASDLKELEAQGFSAMDEDTKKILTVSDKIKAALAKAGVDVSSFGGTLSQEDLERVTGNAALASQICGELKAANLPTSKDNIAETMVAFETAKKLGPLSKDAKAYLLKNDKMPTIQNLYLAEHAGKLSEEQLIQNVDFSGLEKQMEKIIQDAGLEINMEVKQECHWMIASGISLTAGNLSYLDQLNTLSVLLEQQKGLDENLLMEQIMTAIKEGNRPMDAFLLPGYSYMDKAREAMSVITEANDMDVAYCVSAELELSVESLSVAKNNRDSFAYGEVRVEIQMEARFVTAKRQLEETRLAMTIEANYALLKRGVAVDTKPLEQLVEDLKNQENKYLSDLLQEDGVTMSEETIRLYGETNKVVQELKYQPAYILQLGEEEETLRSLHQRGRSMERSFETAQKSYESLWTAPRADLGDSIQKAFGNIDEILLDMDLETSEGNRRAVRILAYNHSDITEKNIQEIKRVDRQLQRLFKNLSPAVTLEMIRKNENPLDMEIRKLNELTEEIQAEIGNKEEERFSKFLWKLEKNHEISEEERSSYIGIYRLISQVEKTDGAAIGSLLNQGSEITMKNLLTAMRSAKKHMDYGVDDSFAGVTARYKTAKIDEQIQAAFQADCMKDVAEQISPEALQNMKDWEDYSPEEFAEKLQQFVREDVALETEAAYYETMATEYSMAMEASDDIYAFLEKYDIKNSAKNVLAASRLMEHPGNVFETLFGQDGKSDSYKEMLAELQNQVMKNFGEAVKTPEELAKAEDTLAEVAERVMQTMIVENEPLSVKDLRDLQLMNQQIFMCQQKVKEESYLVPVKSGDSVLAVSLKVVRGKEQKGMVNIFFRGALMEKVAASFEAKEEGIRAVIATTDEKMRQLLFNQLDSLKEKINEDGKDPLDVTVTKVEDLSMWQFEKTTLAEAGEASKVQTKRLYHIAESFIQFVSKLS